MEEDQSAVVILGQNDYTYMHTYKAKDCKKHQDDLAEIDDWSKK